METISSALTIAATIYINSSAILRGILRGPYIGRTDAEGIQAIRALRLPTAEGQNFAH